MVMRRRRRKGVKSGLVVVATVIILFFLFPALIIIESSLALVVTPFQYAANSNDRAHRQRGCAVPSLWRSEGSWTGRREEKFRRYQYGTADETEKQLPEPTTSDDNLHCIHRRRLVHQAMTVMGTTSSASFVFATFPQGGAAAAATTNNNHDDDDNPLDAIDWNGPKKRGLNDEQMADAINDGLVETEWYVTGMGRPELFSDKFVVATSGHGSSSIDTTTTTTSTNQNSDLGSLLLAHGYEPYCRQVRQRYDPKTIRCELVCCSVTAPHTITTLWRKSGRVNYLRNNGLHGMTLELKPHLVTTTFTLDPEDGNLIVSQVDSTTNTDTGFVDNEDRLGLSLLLYQVPFLRPLVGPPPAASVMSLKQQCDFYTCKLR